MTGPALMYFFFGFVAGLVVVESQKDEPFKKVDYYSSPSSAIETRVYLYRNNRYYDYNQLYPYGYYRYNVNPYSQGNNSGYRSSSNTGGSQVRDTEAGQNQTYPPSNVQDRKPVNK